LEGWNLEPVFIMQQTDALKLLDAFFDPIHLAEWALKRPLKTPALFLNAAGSQATTKSAGQGGPGRRCGVGSLSGRSGLAAGSGAGSSGQGDAQLSQLRQVERGFISGAESVSGDGPPVGL
jgi:hypothetical protein